MPVYRCFAWVYAEGPPEVIDTIVVPTMISAPTRPQAITKFVNEEVIPQNATMEPPYDLADISIGVDVIPEVPNWQP